MTGYNKSECISPINMKTKQTNKQLPIICMYMYMNREGRGLVTQHRRDRDD